MRRVTAENVLPLEDRLRRAARWYASHRTTFPLRCGDAWHPNSLAPLFTSDRRHVGEQHVQAGWAPPEKWKYPDATNINIFSWIDGACDCCGASGRVRLDRPIGFSACCRCVDRPSIVVPKTCTCSICEGNFPTYYMAVARRMCIECYTARAKHLRYRMEGRYRLATGIRPPTRARKADIAQITKDRRLDNYGDGRETAKAAGGRRKLHNPWELSITDHPSRTGIEPEDTASLLIEIEEGSGDDFRYRRLKVRQKCAKP